MLSVRAFDHIVLNVRDIEASADWYQRILGMRRQDGIATDGTVRTSMMFGRNNINLRPIDATQDAWFTGTAPMPGSADLCFLTDSVPDAVADHFRAAGVAIFLGPVDKSGAQGPIRSVYVRDPDGNLIEVSSYAEGAAAGASVIV